MIYTFMYPDEFIIENVKIIESTSNIDNLSIWKISAVIKKLVFDMFIFSPSVALHRNFSKIIICFDFYCINTTIKIESISLAFMLISDKNEHRHFKSWTELNVPYRSFCSRSSSSKKRNTYEVRIQILQTLSLSLR